MEIMVIGIIIIVIAIEEIVEKERILIGITVTSRKIVVVIIVTIIIHFVIMTVVAVVVEITVEAGEEKVMVIAL